MPWLRAAFGGGPVTYTHPTEIPDHEIAAAYERRWPGRDVLRVEVDDRGRVVVRGVTRRTGTHRAHEVVLEAGAIGFAPA